MLFANVANACPMSRVELNNSSWLGADGLYGSKGLMVTIDDLQKYAAAGTGLTFKMKDKDHVVTHFINYLGSISDKGGVMQSSYLIKEVNSGTEKVVVVKSNYLGNGTYSKDIGGANNGLQPIPEFSTLYNSRCN